jgi:hypothetical protein
MHSRDQYLSFLSLSLSLSLLCYFEPTLILLKVKYILEHRSYCSPIPLNMGVKVSRICKLGVDLASDNIPTSTCPTEKSYTTTKATTMLCNECGHALPSIRDSSTICSNCKVPVATWWDETSQTFRTNRESILPDPSKTTSAMASPFYIDEKDREKMRQRRNMQSIEERNFNTALVMLEGHFARPQSYMASSMVVVKKMVATTLEMSLNKADVRYAFFYPVLPLFILQEMLMCAFQRNPSQKRRYLDASAENLQQCCQSPRLQVSTTIIKFGWSMPTLWTRYIRICELDIEEL